MRLIEAMKALKRLTAKVRDLRNKIRDHCAILEDEDHPYPEPDKEVAGWRQAAVDTIAEIARLRMAITRTNLRTNVTIEIGGKAISKPIAYWVLRRRELSAMESLVWSSLTDRGLKPKAYDKGDGEVGVHQVRRFYSAKERDEQLSELSEEPMLIDAALEIANAVTELDE